MGFNYDSAALTFEGIDDGANMLDALYDQDIINDKVFGVAL